MKASFPSLRQLLLTTLLAPCIISLISFAQDSANDEPKADEATLQDDQSIAVPMKTIETALHEAYSKKFEDLPQYTYLRNEVSEESEDHYITTLYLSKGRATPIKVIADLELSYADCTTWDLKKASKWIVQTTRFIRETDKEFAKNSPSEQRRLELIAKMTSGEFLDMTVNEPRLVTGELTCGSFQPLKAAIKEEPEEPKSDMGESEANRQNKSLYVLFETGFHIAPLPSAGLTVGYFLNPNHILELGYAQGFGPINLILVDLEWSIATFDYKYFMGNSFYLNTGLSYQQFILSEGILVEALTKDTIDIKVSSIGVNFAIGNQWQWDNFTLGTDWIGVFVPLNTSADESYKVNGQEPDSAKDLNSSRDTVMQPNLQLLKFYLGISF